MRLGQDIARQVEARDVEGSLRAYSSMGLGALSVSHWNTTRHEFVGNDLFERVRNSSSTTCHLALGFLCGTVTRLTGQTALGTEIACQSRGDACCKFVVSTKKQS